MSKVFFLTDAHDEVAFTLPPGSCRFRADENGTQFWSRTQNHCAIPGCPGATITVTLPLTVTVPDTTAIQYTPVLAPLTLTARTAGIKVFAAPPPAEPARPQPAPLLAPGYTTTRTISYTYDPLYRLTRANYSDGTYFRYTYDACFAEGKSGNRLSEETTGGTVNSYTFDAANRLASVDGVPYTWDNVFAAGKPGNLLSDGVYTYAYSHANRLISVSGAGKTVSYTYSGLGDRLSQTVGITTTNYTLDLAAGLTQVLADGTDMYLYGNGRIDQSSASGAQYFLGDALGSVRQLVDANGEVVLAKDYQPYGEALASAGSAATSYGFTGEWTDIKLIYLRSREYSSSQGRFISKDTWPGMFSRPLTLNKWLYVSGNPINLRDPSGFIEQGEAQIADSIANDLESFYEVVVNQDWGLFNIGYGQCGAAWNKGAWNLKELEWVQDAIHRTSQKLGGDNKFKSAMGRKIEINRVNSGILDILGIRSMAPPGFLKLLTGDVVLTNNGINDELYVKHTVIHELGHVWDENNNWSLSDGMKRLLGTEVCKTTAIGYGLPTIECHYDVTKGKEPWIGDKNTPYQNNDRELILPRDIQGPWEDWAQSFAVYVYSDYASTRANWFSTLGPIRSKYINDQIQAIP